MLTDKQRNWKLSEGAFMAEACDEGLSYEPVIYVEPPQRGYGFIVWFGEYRDEHKVHVLNPVTCEDVAVLDIDEPTADGVAAKLSEAGYAVPSSMIYALFSVLGWRVI